MQQVVHLGDLHIKKGFIKTLILEIKRLEIGKNEDIAYIIQVGDFGIGFYPKSDKNFLLRLNKFLKSRNIVMLVIRGNHDDPAYFKGNHIYSNLQLLEDYTVMDIYDKKYLFIGGAVSIDRVSRQKDIEYAVKKDKILTGWWEDEVFVLDRKKLETITGIDVLITHTTLEYCYPDNRIRFGNFVDSFAENDILLKHDLTIERREVTEMFNILKKNGNKISEMYYGHFHSSAVTMNGYCNHYLLDIYEFK